MAYAGKQLVDAVVKGAATGVSRPALIWLAIEFVLFQLRGAVTNFSIYADAVLRPRLRLRLNTLLLEKVTNVAYSHVEDPAFLNALTQAQREAPNRGVALCSQSFVLLRQTITLIGIVALLFTLVSWAVVALVVLLAVPPFLVESAYGRKLHAVQMKRTNSNREASYFERLILRTQFAQEIKAFGLASWILERYRRIHHEVGEEEAQLAAGRTSRATLVGVLGTTLFYAVLAWIVSRALSGRISLGDMILYTALLRQAQTSIQSMLATLVRVYEDNLQLSNFFRFLELEEDEPHEPIGADPRVMPPPAAVTFERVSFRYPGATVDSLSEVSFHIAAGERVGLVGRNGSGKTTLIKLLLGLYAPTSGRILLDGVDIATLRPAAVREQLGVIFQEFSKYDLTVAENVGVGWLPSLSDRAAVREAIASAGVLPEVEKLPLGVDTLLGPTFGGHELSRGQWQRIALARAILRKSRVLVLDEPTAAMDPAMEHEIFRRFVEIDQGRTAILITHRLSTVRSAHRILVLDGGRLVEEGSHEALYARGGLYKTLFTLQAEGYEPLRSGTS